MFLGTPKWWWILTGVMFLVGLVLFTVGIGGTLGNVVGILLVIGAMVAFAAAPMRYGDKAKKRGPEPAAPAPAVRPVVPLPPAGPPPPRPKIDARDATEV